MAFQFKNWHWITINKSREITILVGGVLLCPHIFALAVVCRPMCRVIEKANNYGYSYISWGELHLIYLSLQEMKERSPKSGSSPADD